MIGINDSPAERLIEPATPESLHQQHYLGLVRMAALMTDDRQMGEEIVQDAFAELISRWSKVNPDQALGYLRTSVTNRSRSALRRRRTVRAHRADRADRAENVAGPEVTVLRAEGFNEVLSAIAALPIRQRQVVVLRYYVGYSIAETAAALGISPAAVSTSANRAMTTLQRLEGDHG